MQFGAPSACPAPLKKSRTACSENISMFSCPLCSKSVFFYQMSVLLDEKRLEDYDVAIFIRASVFIIVIRRPGTTTTGSERDSLGLPMDGVLKRTISTSSVNLQSVFNTARCRSNPGDGDEIIIHFSLLFVFDDVR